MSEIDLTAYAGDCVIRGVVACPEGVRLSDFLNENPTVTVRGLRLFALEDGRVVEGGDQELEVGELWAIEAPPRSIHSAHRVRTRTARVEVELGPYQVLGHLHGPTTSDPLRALHLRKPMIPLTDATLALSFAGQTRMRDLETIIINRDRATLVKPVLYEKGRIDELGLSEIDPRARDRTTEIYL